MGIKLHEIKDKRTRAIIEAAIARSGYSKPKRNGAALVGARTYQKGILDITGPLLVRVTRIVGRGRRLYDRENLIGGAKQLQDALAAALSRKGDSEKDGLRFEYIQEFGNETAVTIEIFRE